MEALFPQDHIGRLIELAHSYGFPLEDIEVVKSIQDWCEERGLEEHNAFRTGKCLRNQESGQYKILLAEEIAPETQSSVISAMELRGFEVEAQVLRDPFVFLAHLLLHEVAHALDEDWSENECDTWAFNEVARVAI